MSRYYTESALGGVLHFVKEVAIIGFAIVGMYVSFGFLRTVAIFADNVVKIAVYTVDNVVEPRAKEGVKK